MNSKIKIYNEKCFYKSTKVPNALELSQKNFCDIRRNSVIFNRTGFVMFKGIIYIIFPFGYKVSDFQYDIQLLLNLFDKLSNEKKLDKSQYDLIEIEHDGNGELLPIAYEIIKDYRENGYVRIENIIQGINIGGKINWKKTLRQKTQIFNEFGMPIFTDLVMSHKESDKEALLRSLHMYVINKSIAMFGALLGISSDYDESLLELPVDKDYALKFLKEERLVTYNSRLLKIMDLIIKFIDCSENNRNNNFTGLSTKSFYSVWELMCKVLVRDEYQNLKEFIPRPYWNPMDGKTIYTEQIPDILYKEGSELFVLDAKYYNVYKNVPGWPDLVKQYFYEMSLRSVMKDVTKSYNAMLFPSDISETAKIWAFSAVENTPTFGQVKGVLVNTKKMLESYCYGSSEDFRAIIRKVIS